MKFLTVAFLVASPALFAQARGGGHSGGGVRGPVRMAPAPAGRPVGVGPVIAAPYPVYFGGYYPNPYYGGYATAPAPADSGPAPAYYDSDPANAQGYPAPGNPTVIVNPYYTPETSNPVLRDYSYMTPPVVAPPDQSSPDQPAAPSVIFLIAMKSHTIYPAIAYWVQDDTLNYITPQGVRNQVSLDMVDRAFSTQLNKERNIDFGLPAAK